MRWDEFGARSLRHSGVAFLDVPQIFLAQLLQLDERILSAARRAQKLIGFQLQRGTLPVLRVLDQKNINIATISETVLMMSCQVSFQWKRGPLANHTRVRRQAARKAILDPVTFAAFWASFANQPGQ